MDETNASSGTDTSFFSGWTDWGKSNAGNIAATGFKAIGNVVSAYATSDQNDRTIDQLKYELRRNKAKMIYDWQKSDASNQVSFFSRGISPTSGSAAGILASNKYIVDDNIRDMERAVNAKISNLKAQSKNAITSAWLGAAGDIVGLGLDGAFSA